MALNEKGTSFIQNTGYRKTVQGQNVRSMGNLDVRRE